MWRYSGEIMPRRKPDRVDVVRFELGSLERELLKDIVLGYQIKSVGTPAVALMSDVSGMITLASLLALIGIVIDLDGITIDSDMSEVVTRIKEGYNNYSSNVSAERREDLRKGGDDSFLGGVRQMVRMTVQQIINPPDVDFQPFGVKE